MVNSELIFNALSETIFKNGLDKTTLTDVAKRAGLTSGAVYARYEGLDDLCIDLWRTKASADLFNFIEHGRNLIIERGSSELSTQKLDSKYVHVALQILIASRRNPVLREGIERDLREWEDKWGLGVSASPTLRMRSSIATALVLGHSLTSFIHFDESQLKAVRNTVGDALAVASSSDAVHEAQNMAVVAHVSDMLHGDLINAAMEVINRSGYEMATVSRIARLANCTTGAIYSRYESKNNLVIDAIEILISAASRASSKLVIEGANENNLSTSVARIFHTALLKERQIFNGFRLETYLAAAWDPSILRCVRRIRQTSNERYFSLLQPTNLFTDEIIERIAYVGQTIPIGFAALSTISEGYRTVDYLEVSKKLMQLCGAS